MKIQATAVKSRAFNRETCVLCQNHDGLPRIPVQKAPYVKKADKDKKRYAKEMAKYNKSK